jgi:hypothetical protein
MIHELRHFEYCFQFAKVFDCETSDFQACGDNDKACPFKISNNFANTAYIFEKELAPKWWAQDECFIDG